MKTLTSSSSKTLTDKYRGGSFLLFRDFHNRPEIRFVKYRKYGHMGFSNLISLQHKTVLPIFSSSSSSESQVALEETESRNDDITQTKTVHVKLQLQKECLFGEQFLIVGDDPMLGLWDPSDAIPLEWSDGHIWTVELDIPVDKSIQFKLILKGTTGYLFWQPGPDRILRTWETKNTITVYEVWENADCQKIIEEEPAANKNKETTINSEMLIVTENLTSSTSNTINNPAENSLEEIHDELIFAQNTTGLQEKPLALIAENITYPKENPVVISDALGDNGKATTVKNPASTDVECLGTYEGGAILVPGLTPLAMVPTEAEPLKEDERSVAVNTSVEAKNHISPELKEEEEPQQEETSKMINEEEELHESELKQKPQLAKDDFKTITNAVYKNDVQWGRRTLQKLLGNFGLL